MMRGGGVGGPLLCIGDLLSDVGEEDTTVANDIINHTSVEFTNQPSDLTKLYQVSILNLVKIKIPK